jgi:hypothetical protein
MGNNAIVLMDPFILRSENNANVSFKVVMRIIVPCKAVLRVQWFLESNSLVLFLGNNAVSNCFILYKVIR